MTKVLLATEKPFAASAVSGIRAILDGAGFETILLEKYSCKNELLQAVADVQAIIVRSDIIDAEVLDAAKELKIVVRAGAGYDNIDLDAATKHGVCVMNTPGQNANAVAELVVGMLLFGIRNRFNGTSGTELMGKKIGLLAFGATGRNVARIAKGLAMEVYAYDPFSSKEQMEAEGVHFIATQAELFATCDIVSMHIPATPETKGSIGKALVGSMPKKAILVNTARKEIINEAELLEVLKEREDLRYFTDIQPACHAEMVEALGERYFATPKKMGAQTSEANTNAGLAAARQIVGFIKEGNERFRLNK